MGSQLANQVDWVSLSRKVSRQCRDVLGVRLAAEELCRLLSEDSGLLGGRLHLTSEFETIVLQHGKGQEHALTIEVDCSDGRGTLEVWPKLPDQALVPAFAGFEALIQWMVTDWFRRLEVTFGSGGGGEESLMQLGAALAGAHQLDQLLQMILQTYVRVSQARGGAIHLIESGWETATRALGSETSRSLTIALVRHQQVKALMTLFFEPGDILLESRLNLLFALAKQAALAIDNMLNHEREQEQAREAQILYKAARSIDEGQDLEEVLEQSAGALARVADVRRCLVLLRDQQRTYFSVVAATGLSPDQEEFFAAFRLTLSQFPDPVRKLLTEGESVSSTEFDLRESALGRLCSIMPGAGFLLVPLLVKDRVIGLIYLDDPRGDAQISEAARRMVLTLSFQVGNAIQRATLLNQLQENLGPLRALYQVSTAITGTLSLNKVVKLIVEQAVELLEHSACALLVLDEMGEGFRLETSVGLSDELLEPALQARMARVAVERKKATALYLEKDPEAIEFEGVLKRANFGGLLTVPLVARKKMVGVLNCFVAPSMRFRQQEIRFLRGFANQAAIAVENARLHGLVRFKMGELGTLFEVSKAITSTLQLDRVLEEIVRHVRDILRADACSLMLLEANYLVLKTSEGLVKTQQCKPIPLGVGVAGTAAKTGQPTVVLDQEDGHANEFPNKVREQGLKTILCVPVETRGRVIGLINVYFRDLMTHTPAQVNLLIALGSQAAVAIENARLYAEKQRVTELLHTALIPKEKLGFQGVMVGHRFIPSMDLSGDYYDLIPLDDERFFLVIADVSGKGPDAAIQALQAKHILGSYALAGYGPAASLRMLNHQIAQHSSSKQITVFCAQADMTRRQLRFACAGHEQPLFMKPGGAEPELLRAEGILIGAIDDYEYPEQTVELQEGSLVLLYTDGITEARTPQGEFFGLSRIMQAMVAHGDGHPTKLVNGLYNKVRKFTRENITDDFSLLAVRF
ncbi:SpoIIE family protein phosphatase [bacterium]|nr:SpoIIE family protein phosphatase [bacterium]